jgi:hypothetical protein
MLTRMSDSPKSDPRARAPAEDAGVLANLPRTRPQRASPRRASPHAPSSRKAPTKTVVRRAPTKRARAHTPPVQSAPRQGYEPVGEDETDSLNRPIQPPGATELAASIAELAGELAKAGVDTGARLLKDIFSRLPPG